MRSVRKTHHTNQFDYTPAEQAATLTAFIQALDLCDITQR